MQLKGSYEKERCQFCFRNDLYEETKTKSGRVRLVCRCGYSWLKENWTEMLSRTGKMWAGHKYMSDHLEEQFNITEL